MSKGEKGVRERLYSEDEEEEENTDQDPLNDVPVGKVTKPG